MLQQHTSSIIFWQLLRLTLISTKPSPYTTVFQLPLDAYEKLKAETDWKDHQRMWVRKISYKKQVITTKLSWKKFLIENKYLQSNILKTEISFTRHLFFISKFFDSIIHSTLLCFTKDLIDDLFFKPHNNMHLCWSLYEL